MQVPYKASVGFTSADNLLVKASHVVGARVRVGRTPKISRQRMWTQRAVNNLDSELISLPSDMVVSVPSATEYKVHT